MPKPLAEAVGNALLQVLENQEDKKLGARFMTAYKLLRRIAQQADMEEIIRALGVIVKCINK